MQQKNVTFRKWLIRSLLLFSLIGIGFWLLAGSAGGGAQTYASEPSRPRPEIDLQVPATTETALFALG